MKMMKYANGMMAAGAALVASCVVIGCDSKKPDVVAGGPKPAVASPSVGGLTVLKPAEPNGFERTVSMLDVGGPFLLYFSTAQILNNISAEIEGWKPAVLAVQKDDPEATKKTDLIFGLTSNLLKKSGLEQLDGIGLSVFPVEAGLTRSKGFVQHPKGDLSKTLIWNLFGTKAHALNEIKLLPKNTTFTYFSDFDFPFLWNFIKTEAKSIPEPEISQGIDTLPAQFEQGTGLKWDDMLASLGNNYGFVVTLDPAKKFPIPGVGTEIGEPAMALVIKTKNDLIFKKLDEVLTQMGSSLPEVTKSDEGDVHMRSATLPPQQGLELSPTIAQTKDYLIISSSKALVQSMLDSFTGKVPGLAATSDEFKRLRANTPEEGNAFSFVSKEFGVVMTQIQKAAASTDDDDALPPEAMDKFLSSYVTPSSLSVSAHLEDGWYGVTNSGASYAAIVQPVRSLPGLGLMAAILGDKDVPEIDIEEDAPEGGEATPAPTQPMDNN